MLCIITFHISLFKIFSKSNDFPREKQIFFYRMKTNFFMITIFALLIIYELQKMNALCNTDSLIV